jgi:hypothetical protein
MVGSSPGGSAVLLSGGYRSGGTTGTRRWGRRARRGLCVGSRGGGAKAPAGENRTSAAPLSMIMVGAAIILQADISMW